MRLALLLLLALAACEPAPERNQSAAAPAQPEAPPPTGKLDRSHAGRPAPATAFEDPDGEPASLADFRGKPLLVNLWATWCAPCIAEMPTLDKLAEREGEKLQVVTISQDLDGRERVEAFFAKHGYRNLETWLDPQMALMTGLDVKMLPTTILYDRQGRELWRVVGDEDWSGAKATRLLAEASREAAR